MLNNFHRQIHAVLGLIQLDAHSSFPVTYFLFTMKTILSILLVGSLMVFCWLCRVCLVQAGVMLFHFLSVIWMIQSYENLGLALVGQVGFSYHLLPCSSLCWRAFSLNILTGSQAFLLNESEPRKSTVECGSVMLSAS